MTDSKPENNKSSPIAGRILAALVDYFFVISATSLIEKSYPTGELSFILFLGFAAIYYTVSNSDVLNGQSIGKRLFGLRTALITNRKDGGSPYLTLSKSFARFLIFLGLTTLLKELPPTLYRELMIEGPRTLLDLPLLLALGLFFADIATMIIHSHPRALHDILTGSVVIRHPENKTLGELDRKPLAASHYNPKIGTIVGIAVASIFWMLSVIQPPQLQAISRKQFIIEKLNSLQIIHIASYVDTISMMVVANSDAAKGISPFEQCTGIARKLAPYILEDQANKETNSLELTCIDQKNQEESSVLMLNIKSGEISKVEDPFAKSN